MFLFDILYMIWSLTPFGKLSILEKKKKKKNTVFAEKY